MSKLTSTALVSEWDRDLAEGTTTRDNWGPTAQPPSEWQGYERVLFRFFFLYFIIQVVPLDWHFYRDLLTIDWGPNYYQDVFNLARYAPRFIGPDDTFANWAIVALIALVGTLIWSIRDTKRTEYNALYYGLRVILRYRLAIGVIAYGFIKLFPMQAPLPSISNLNTAYGDFTAWKLFSLSLGIVPSYESFLGLVEIIGGLLLLNRKTATIGTLIIIPFTGNVFMSNLAYEGGEYVYSFYLITIALFLFAFDAIRLVRLVSLEKPTVPNRFVPVWAGRWKVVRPLLKGAFLLFAVGLYGYKTYGAYRTDPYQYPKTPGLTGAAGLYNVREFKLADKVLPYSKTDSKRWQDVVFERWNTISIKSNRPVRLDKTNTEQLHAADAARTYEFAGSAGRHYYSYQVDSLRHVLTLSNRNPNYVGETLQLHYERSGPNEIILSGLNESQDSVYVVLDKVNKKYLLNEAAKAGRRGTLKL
ncbi:DoxX family protein [Spirosoma soli]|uniref:DoxX family protein n=1 Tax=Spirosoma soli TaxID=1770529 RepID=A0ABW5M6S8_9BACT